MAMPESALEKSGQQAQTRAGRVGAQAEDVWLIGGVLILPGRPAAMVIVGLVVALVVTGFI